jgi:hypothetical protein
MPALVATYVLFDAGWRRILLACYVVAAATYIWEYALVGALGSFLVAFFDGSSSLHRLSDRVSTPEAQTLVRLPLFAAFLVVLVAGGLRVWTSTRSEDRSVG